MKTFKIDKDLQIVCESKNTRNGFKHEATLIRNGLTIDFAKVCYLNRTWESFEYETVIQKLLDKTNLLSKTRKKNFLKRASGIVRKRTSSVLRSVAMVSALGDILCKEPKEKNDWKVRMLKAGLGGKGLIIPDDWNELTEEEKTRRLKRAEKVLLES